MGDEEGVVIVSNHPALGDQVRIAGDGERRRHGRGGGVPRRAQSPAAEDQGADHPADPGKSWGSGTVLTALRRDRFRTALLCVSVMAMRAPGSRGAARSLTLRYGGLPTRLTARCRRAVHARLCFGFAGHVIPAAVGAAARAALLFITRAAAGASGAGMGIASPGEGEAERGGEVGSEGEAGTQPVSQGSPGGPSHRGHRAGTRVGQGRFRDVVGVSRRPGNPESSQSGTSSRPDSKCTAERR